MIKQIYIKKNIFMVIVVLLAISGCTTPKATYHHQKQDGDPTVYFDSDFDLHTHFFVNNNADNNLCADEQRVGYILKVDSMFIYDKANPQLSIVVPKDKPIIVMGNHSFSNGSRTTTCGPVRTMFTPKAGHEYVAKMNLSSSKCYITIHDKSDNQLLKNQQLIGVCRNK